MSRHVRTVHALPVGVRRAMSLAATEAMPQEAGANPLQYFVSAMSLKQGRITAKLVLKVLAPKGLDSNAGTDLRLVLP